MNDFLVDFNNSRFLETSTTAAEANRLNWRCHLLLGQNKNLLQGKRVLDIGSHDGRFSSACLKLGAAHVTGIEGRDKLVKHAEENLVSEGFDQTRFNFIAGDVFDILKRFEEGSFDVVLCSGFLYHTVKQFDFYSEMHRLKPETLIVDTAVCKKPAVFEESSDIHSFIENLRQEGNWHKPLAKAINALMEGQYFVFIKEDSQREGSTIDPSGVVAIPSDKAIEMLFELYGFTYQRINWLAAGISDWNHLEDYQQGDRVSYVGRF